MKSNYGMATGSYVRERDDWWDAIERARSEGWSAVELTAIVDSLLATLPEFLALSPELLDGFDRISLHAPIWAESPTRTVETIALLPLDGDVIFHPDAWGNEQALDRLGGRVVFENMDRGKTFGRSAEDLASVFARHDAAGFCLDVAHVWTCDPTLALGHELLDAFGARLRQLHVSGIEPDGTHRTTTAEDLRLYHPLLERCGHVPWILEAVVSPNTGGPEPFTVGTPVP
jgi:hypothetical protein